MPLNLQEGYLLSHDPKKYLPHANPFLFIDVVTSLETGAFAEGIKTVTGEQGEYPWVFLIESIAQLAGIAAGHEEGEGGFLAAIDHAEFFGSVGVGDRIVVTTRIVKSFGRLHLCEGEAAVGDRMVASARITLGVGKV